jgi:exopolyphosphatase/guanosine-5'-triphosphate,3'-diphosphate pyrophosphatase
MESKRSRVRIAGIDCGTNSIRLMIADVDHDGLHVVVPRMMDVVRLGEGVDQNHRFASDALERTYRACRRFRQVIDETGGVDAVRFVATSASRDAENRGEFEDTVESILHVRPRVIPGVREANLSFLGATSALDPQTRIRESPLMVVDLGGGSTELVVGTVGPDMSVNTHAISLNIGSVRMSERHWSAVPPTAAEVQEATDDIDAHLSEATQAIDFTHVRTLIGVSGTFTTVSLIAMGEKQYSSQKVDGAVIPFDQAHHACSRLLTLSTDEMARDWPVINAGRRDVIGGGALVLSRLLTMMTQQTKKSGRVLDHYTASERGLLYGIIIDAGRELLAS